jgi:hypothetical protein
MSASGLGPRTVRWVHSVLKMTLDYAIDEGQLLSRNPGARTKFPPLRQATHTYLTTSEVAALADACRSQGDVVLLLAYTGMRFGELVGLRVEDVDLKARRIRVRRGAPFDTRPAATRPDPHRPGGGQVSRRSGEYVTRRRFARAGELEALNRVARRHREDRATQDEGARPAAHLCLVGAASRCGPKAPAKDDGPRVDHGDGPCVCRSLRRRTRRCRVGARCARRPSV